MKKKIFAAVVWVFWVLSSLAEAFADDTGDDYSKLMAIFSACGLATWMTVILVVIRLPIAGIEFLSVTKVIMGGFCLYMGIGIIAHVVTKKEYGSTFLLF